MFGNPANARVDKKLPVFPGIGDDFRKTPGSRRPFGFHPFIKGFLGQQALPLPERAPEVAFRLPPDFPYGPVDVAAKFSKRARHCPPLFGKPQNVFAGVGFPPRFGDDSCSGHLARDFADGRVRVPYFRGDVGDRFALPAQEREKDGKPLRLQRHAAQRVYADGLFRYGV